MKSLKPLTQTIIGIAALCMLSTHTQGKDWYVCKETGRGKAATKERPAKDLGYIIPLLKAGDVVHIAEGVYTSRGDMGSDIIKEPVSIIGGYDKTFSKRDPWGAHKTILTGTPKITGSTMERLFIDLSKNRTLRDKPVEILIDGLIIDNGPRNRYKTDQELLVLRSADNVKELNASSSRPGIYVDATRQENAKVIIQNCIVMNVGSSLGAYYLKLYKGSEGALLNNLAINNTGDAFYLTSSWKSSNPDEWPKYRLENNSALFTQKYDGASQSHTGNGLMMDAELKAVVKGNVFAFSDVGGINNIKGSKDLLLLENLFTGNRKLDYSEKNVNQIGHTDMSIMEIEDEAFLLDYESLDNVSEKIQVPVSEAWASAFYSREVDLRAKIDAAAKAENSDINAVRSMLGLAVRGADVNIDNDVWMPRMSIEEAVKCGGQQYAGKYGCSMPKSE